MRSPLANSKLGSVTVIALCQVAAMALWFSASAVVPALAAEYRLSKFAQAALTSGVQAGFVVGCLASAILGLADRIDPRRFFAVAASIGALAIIAGRADSTRLVALVVLGYLTAWFGFGVLAHAADLSLQAVGARTSWLLTDGWIVGAVVLAGAGAFQFSALKYRCLDKCRTPLGFIVERWRGRAPGREALELGFDHGLFCVGCCWALMLLMFVVGTGSLGWMLALSAVMAAEKNLPGGGDSRRRSVWRCSPDRRRSPGSTSSPALR